MSIKGQHEESLSDGNIPYLVCINITIVQYPDKLQGFCNSAH